MNIKHVVVYDGNIVMRDIEVLQFGEFRYIIKHQDDIFLVDSDLIESEVYI